MGVSGLEAIVVLSIIILVLVLALQFYTFTIFCGKR